MPQFKPSKSQQTNIKLGKDEIKGAAMDILNKRSWSKMNSANRQDVDEQITQPTSKKQLTEDQKKIQLLKKELKDAYQEINQIDKTIHDAWTRVK